MTHEPRTKEQIYEELRTDLTGKIAKLTNFTERSFNYVWTQAFADDLRELELKVLASEFAGFVDYSGGPVEDSDLQRLGIADTVDVEDIEPYLDDQHLDEFVKIVGISRLPGSRATGAVDIETETDENVTVPEGTIVTTAPDSNGNTLGFETAEEVTASEGTTTITDVSIQAQEVGPKYNVPANSIVRFAEPPVGVTGVTNPSATTGGEEEETNEKLRERAKNAVAEQSGGGTVEGIKGYIVASVEGVRDGDVILEEFVDNKPPYVDVIVDGGTDSSVKNAIEASRPAAIQHNLVRPEVVQIEVDAALNGTDIDTVKIKDRLETFLLTLGISDTFYEDEVIREIMTTDEDVINVAQLDVYVQRVTNETFTYDSNTQKYRLEYSHDGTSISVSDEEGNTYTEGTDYNVIDDTGDGVAETIQWDTTNSTPVDGDDFFVNYDVNQEARLTRHEPHTHEEALSETYTYENTKTDYEVTHPPLDSTVSITDASGDTYTKGTDYSLVSAPGQSENDSFVYDSGRTDYKLDYSTQADTVSVTDEGGDSYTRGTDYTLVDTNGDGLVDSIRWDTSNSTPADDETFTVSYKRQNGIEQTIRWDTSNATPDDSENFTVTYDRALYQTNREIVDAPDDKILDASGNSYTEDTDYQFADYTADGELDSVKWIDGQPNPDDDEEFYVTYYTEGDLYFSNRQKADPGSITVTVE